MAALLLLEASVDERATLEAAFALIDGDDWRADAARPLHWPLAAPALSEDGGDCSDAVSSSDSSAWVSDEPPQHAVAASVDQVEEVKERKRAVVACVQSIEAARQQPPARRTRVKNRKKEELDRLRADVKVLQARADFLERRRVAACLKNSGAGLVAVATQPTAFRIALGAARGRLEERLLQPDARLAGMWKAIAERQLQRRTASEMDNTRLRALVKSHQRTVKSLAGILQRQAAAQRTMAPTQRASTSRVARDNFSPAEVDALRAMWDELDPYYLATDHALQLNGLASAGLSPVMATQVTPLSATATLVEVMGNGLFPMDYRDTTAVMWQFLVNNSSSSDAEQSKAGLEQCGLPDDGHSIVRSYSLDHRVGSAHVVLHGSHATRKYLEQDRAVIVYSGVTRPVEIQGKRVAGIRTVDRGRIVTSDVSSGASGPLCLCQASNEIVVEVDPARVDEKVHVKALADVVIAMKRDIYERLRDGFEGVSLGRAPSCGFIV